MKVRVDISPEYKEPLAVIHADRVTEDIRRIIDLLGTSDTPVTATGRAKFTINTRGLHLLQPLNGYSFRFIV